jgi:hypothetical protein
MSVSALKYARVAWRRGVYTSLREVLRAMKEGGDVEMRLVNQMMSDILNRTESAMEEIGVARFERITKSATPNYFGLFEMLKERAAYYSDRLNDYRFLIKQFDNPSIAIGRRGQDIVREISLDTLEEGFLRGNPTAFTETKLLERLVNSKNAELFPDRATAEATMKAFRNEVIDKIPLFNEDGEAKFLLRVRQNGVYVNPPKYQAWSAEQYADLVAITTAGEADAAANLEHAREIGTRLIKWNSTGKGKAFYESIGDYRCAAVDGEIASLEPTGTTINGVTYPYWRTILPGPFNTCHPRCRHRFVPLPEWAAPASQASTSTTAKVERESTKSIRDAEKIAKGYGVKNVKYGSDENLAIASQINQVLKEMVESGKPVPKRVQIDAGFFNKHYGRRAPSVQGAFVANRDPNRALLMINPQATAWRNPKLIQENYTAGRWASDHPLAVIHHEMGHFLHMHNYGYSKYSLLRTVDLTKKEREMIAQEVSLYATANVLEFVAEVYAGMMAGRKFSSEIMALYKRFGGVEV